MSRLERPKQASKNPAKKFLEWKSNDKAFEYYDKEKGERISVPLPLKVLFLEHYHTVKGWHDASQSGIFANEVYAISKEELTVKTFKNMNIAKGLYKDVKVDINMAGGKYTRSIYVMDEAGDILNIQLKGAAVGGINKESSATKKEIEGYSDFYSNCNQLLDNQWIEIKSVGEGKKGAVKFAIPIFEAGSHVTDAQNELANKAVKVLQDFVNERKETVAETTVEEIEVNEVEDVSDSVKKEFIKDLPF